MQIVQELEAEGAWTRQARDELLLSFLESSERLNKYIAWHQSLEEPSELSIDEFSDLRDNYIKQVRLSMNHCGLEVKPLLTTPNARQQVA